MLLMITTNFLTHVNTRRLLLTEKATAVKDIMFTDITSVKAMRK